MDQAQQPKANANEGVDWGFSLDHVNIRTEALERLVAFYEEALGLKRGPRPPFDFPGAWLYAGSRAVVHLIGVPRPPEGSKAESSKEGRALRLEHYALRAGSQAQLPAFLAHLKRLGVEAQVATLPDGSAVQVNLWDPDGNHLHLDFTPPAGWTG
jgi:catechol 2,3-dioxygenase-like lactoylglutathione lyase family enzyme